MRIIFAGTPEFSVPTLQTLIEQFEVVAVFTQPDRKAGRGKKLTPPPTKVLALEHQIPVYQPTKLADQVELIEKLDADVMVVIAYGLLLPQSILDIPRLGCINIHASLLPRWRGAAPIHRAIQAGDTETGVCIMQMEAGLDTGPVFDEAKLAIETNDTSATLHDKLAELGAQRLVSVLNDLQQNPKLKALAQSEEGVTYAKKINKTEAEIDWNQSARQIEQSIRAFIPWPICQTWHNGVRLRIWQASVVEINSKQTAGEIIKIDEHGIQVACGDQALQVEKIQRDGSKPLTVREFCNGYDFSTNNRFETQSN